VLQVWNKEDPCFICGFDMDPLGAVQALASQPEGTAICCFSLEQPGSLVIACKQKGADASAEDGGVLQVKVCVAADPSLLFPGLGIAEDGSTPALGAFISLSVFLSAHRFARTFSGTSCAFLVDSQRGASVFCFC
jgi:hypothetical protein